MKSIAHTEQSTSNANTEVVKVGSNSYTLRSMCIIYLVHSDILTYIF